MTTDSAESDSGFRPTRHGYRFANRFPLPLGGAYGLCGGMTFRARRFFQRGQPIPSVAAVPRFPRREFLALQFEQWRSLALPPLGFGGEAWRYVAWMRAPLDGERGIRRRTAQELMRLEQRLDSGRPVPIGLIKVRRGEGRIWQNHQVLAYAIEARSAASSRVRIYDPNYPLDDGVSLEVEVRNGQAITSLRHRGRGSLPIPGWFLGRGERG